MRKNLKAMMGVGKIFINEKVIFRLLKPTFGLNVTDSNRFLSHVIILWVFFTHRLGSFYQYKGL